MTILESFQKDIGTGYDFRTIIDNLTDTQINECIEDYASQFKIHWKYPSKNEFPEIKMNAVFLGVKFKNEKYITMPVLWHYQTKGFTNMLLVYIDLIAWCELPNFINYE